MTTLDDYLANVRPDQQARVRTIDGWIRQAAPGLDCSLKWGQLTYHHRRNVCALAVHARHVNLQLWNGAALNHPQGLLEGSGKAMRHVSFRDGAAPDADAVIALVLLAAGDAATASSPASPKPAPR